MAGPAHDIGEDERQKRFKKPAADAIQHLDGQEPGRIVKPYAKPAAQRKRSEGEQQKRLATEHIRSALLHGYGYALAFGREEAVEGGS